MQDTDNRIVCKIRLIEGGKGMEVKVVVVRRWLDEGCSYLLKPG